MVLPAFLCVFTPWKVIITANVHELSDMEKKKPCNHLPVSFPTAHDHQALIWDIQPMPQPIEVPILAYAAEGEINQFKCSGLPPNLIGLPSATETTLRYFEYKFPTISLFV